MSKNVAQIIAVQKNIFTHAQINTLKFIFLAFERFLPSWVILLALRSKLCFLCS